MGKIENKNHESTARVYIHALKGTLNNKKGITLVALVVTIIILLILAGISIASLIEKGLFEKAKEARERTLEEQNNENEKLESYINIIDENSNNNNSNKYISDIYDIKLNRLFTILNTNIEINDILQNKILKNDIDQTLIIEGPVLSQNNGKPYASSEYSTLPAWYAFKNETERYNSGNTTQWPVIGYDFGEEVFINGLDIVNYSADSTAIKTFNIQYSNDKLEWKNANSEILSIEQNETKNFKFDIKKARYWQIQILSNYGYSNYNCSLNQIKFYGIKCKNTQSQLRITDSEEVNYLINLLNDNGKKKITLNDMAGSKNFLNKIKENEEAKDYIFNDAPEFIDAIENYSTNNNILISNPIMTSDSSPSGHISYSSQYYPGVEAFDNNLSTGWTPISGEDISNSYIQYAFDNEVWCKKIVLDWKYEGGNGISFVYIIKGSKDGINFDILSEEQT